MGRPLTPVVLTDAERMDLERWSRGRTVSHWLVMRARIVLACADGKSPGDIAQELGVAVATVSKWKSRFLKARLPALHDLPRPNVDRKLSDEKVEEMIRTTLQTVPEGQTHWSTRQLAERVGVSQASVSRVWRAFKLQPHRQGTFTLSTDDFFIEKVRDVVGLYMNPPDNALVLCVDEKSQIQAQERRQPVLPMIFGKPQRRTPQYLRHGTTTLFAALDISTGEVIGECYPQHRAIEFRKFLNKVDKETPKELEVHLVMDNYATHSTAEIQRWLKRHKRFRFHFVPTYSSWLNQVERWFGLLSERAQARGLPQHSRARAGNPRVHRAAQQRTQALRLDQTANQIIAAVARHSQQVLAFTEPE